MGTGGRVGPCLLPQAPQCLQSLRFKAVVGVQKGDVLPLSLIQSGVPGGADAGVFLLVDHPDPVILSGETVA